MTVPNSIQHLDEGIHPLATAKVRVVHYDSVTRGDSNARGQKELKGS